MPSANRLSMQKKNAPARQPARPLALLLVLACLACGLGTPSASTQTQTRPRKASPSSASPSTDANQTQRPGPDRDAKPDAAEVVKPPAKPADEGPEAIDEDEVVKITSSEVLLPVTVRDGAGRLVSDLKREDFRVYEDGREQPLSELSLRRVPVDVALLVDSSSSVAASFEDFRRAAEEFAARLDAEDRISLIKFDDRIELLLDWTRSRLQLRRALKRLTTGVFTRFNDALLLAAREQFKQGRRRHALVVLSDGIDSGRGRATLEAALRSLLESQVAVYVISNTEIERARKQSELDNLLAGNESSVRFNELRIGDLREGVRVLDASERNLSQLTSATGGRLYKPPSFATLDRVYTEIAEELRSQYALYYTPTDPARDGRFRRVKVEVPGRGLQVNTRIGYFAPR